MNILLIDKRVQDYETIVAAIDPTLAVGVVFDYYEDTFDAVKARIGALGLTNGTNQISVGLIQHNYKAPMFSMLASAEVAPVSQVATQDPELEMWTQFRDFITWCKTTPEIGAAHFDMMACALYSDPDWKHVIDTLTTQTGMTVRASTDDTGAASLGGDWFLESHTGINLKTVYFTEAIEEYRGVLYIGYYLSVTNRDYSTKAVVASNVITWGNSSVSSSSVASSLSSGVVAVYSTEEAFAALKTTGNVITWGLSGGDSSSVTSSLVNVVNIYSNRFAFAALKSDGSIVAWGDSSAGGTAPSSVTAANSGVVAVYNTVEAFAALKSDGSVVTWGKSDYGAHTAPSSVTAANSNVVAIYSNTNAFVALKSDGSIVQWGFYIDPPSSVTDANSGVVVVYVTGGGTFAALKSDGSVIVWGGGLVSGLAATDVISVFYNSGALVGLKSNGSVVELGASGGAPSSVTAANSGVVSVCSTTSAFAALKSDGSVVAWGETYQGGTAPSSVTNANSGVVALYTGHDGFIALKSDGSVDMWGQLIPRTNISGQYSSVSSRLTSGIVAAYTGIVGHAALKNTGEVVTWGESEYGIGNSSSVSSSFGSGVIAMNLIYPQNSTSGGAALKTAATTFDLSMSYYSNMDRYDILRKKENRRRVNLTTLNNNVFTLSTVRDIQVINSTIPVGEPLRIIVPDYVSSPLSITSTATIPSGLSSVIIACDECEPVTISGTTYVNYGTFVYTLNASGSYVKTTSTTINQRPYSLYGGDGFRSSGIALLDARTVPTLSSTTFSVASNKTFGDASFNDFTRPTSDSSGAITYSSSNTAVATIDASGTWITLVGAGDVNFIATQESNESYAGATKTSNTLTVQRGTSDFSASTFSVASSKTFGDASFNIITAPTSNNSNGAITYSSSNTAVATIDISGTWITLVAAGDVSFNATQAQTVQYASSIKTSNTLTVALGTTSLSSFSVAGSKTFGDVPFSATTTPTSDSSGAITYSSSATGVATINPSSGIITLVAAGTATFTASQAQSAQYNAPTPVTSNTLTVSLGTPTLSSTTFSVDSNKTYGDASFNNFTRPTSNSSGAITYRVNELAPTWQQRGNDIDGEAAEDDSGSSISISADGTVVAIGAPFNAGTGRYAGHVRVYSWNSALATWSKRGGDIDAENAYDRSGSSVSLSADGNVVAIGAPYNPGSGGVGAGQVRVYVWNSGTSQWVRRGVVDIDGEYANTDGSGFSVSLSSDGTIVAIGAPYNYGTGINAGHVRVYEWNSVPATWTKRGLDIDGEASQDRSGTSVSLSADGSVVAIGAPNNNSSRGHVRVYVWNITTLAWEKRGVDLDGENTGDKSGHSVSLSSDGTVVAIGAFNNNNDFVFKGQVRVYFWNTGTSAWVRRGADIDGEATNDQSGYSVSLSSDGTVLAVGANNNDGNGNNSGHVRIYAWNSTTSVWNLYGADIDGEAAGDESGYSVSLSADGNVVAIGTPVNNGNGWRAGHVRVYAVAPTATIDASGNWITLLKAGTVSFTASQAAVEGQFISATNTSNTLTVSLATPTLSSTTFSVASSKTYGDASFNITTVPTSNSSGVITYTSSNTAVATIDPSGTWITILSAGDVSFNASQAATSQYTSATKASNTLTVSLATPTLSSTTFSVASNKTFGDASFNNFTRPTSNSSGVITYSSSNPAVATIDASGTWITLVGSGDVSFNATQAQTTQYTGATKTSNTLTVQRGTTTLARTAMDATISKTFGIDISFNVVATSDSNGAVTYTSSAPDVATVGLSTGLVTPVSAGQTTITAQQAQTAQYNVPTSITSVLTVLRGTTSLSSFSVADSKTFGAAPFSIDTAPTSASSGAITYSSDASGVAIITSRSGIITLVSAGTATFTASQAQSAQYNAPTPVTSNTLTVSKVTPTLAFVSPPTSKSLTDAAFTITATSGILFSVSNSGSGAYVINGSSNPTLTVIRGMRYILSVNASGHPFWIQTVSGAYSGGNIYSNSSIVNNGEDVGNIIWEVAFDTPTTLYYACQYHSSMQGVINVV